MVEPRVRGGGLPGRDRHPRPAGRRHVPRRCAIPASSGSTAPSARGRSATSRPTRARARSSTPSRASTPTAAARRRGCGATCATPARAGEPEPGRGNVRVAAPGLPLRARGGPHDRPDAQLGRHDVRLGLGDGLPRPQRPAPGRRGSTCRTRTRKTSARTTGWPIRWGYTPDAATPRSTRSCATGRRAGSCTRATTTRAGPNTTGAPTPWSGCARRRTSAGVILSRFGPAPARARRVAARPDGALQPRVPVPSLRHPGRPAVRGRPVPDERGEGRRPDAAGLGRSRRGSARPWTC